MVSRLEIKLKEELMDSEGASIKRKARDYFNFEVEDIRVPSTGRGADLYLYKSRNRGIILFPYGQRL